LRAGRAPREDLGLIGRRTFLLSPLALAAAMSGQAARRKPNVVLIVAGLWRAQAVPWAGDTDVDAPNLAKLSQQAVSFSRAYACYSRLYRALPCLLRGVFPHTLAGMDATIETLLAESPSLGTVLRNAGYRAAKFQAHQAGDIVPFIHSPTDQAGDRPFFVEWTFENLGGGLMERRDPSSLHLRENVPAYAEATARAELRTFYARAGACDRDIGIVLEALDRPGLSGNPLAEDTIVVFTSLHGEQFGSHGESGDDSVYEESIRIPLLIRYPRAIRHTGPSDMLVSQVDLAPTLFQWCGVPIPQTVQGRDLSDLLTGESTSGQNTSGQSPPVQSNARPDAIYAEGRLGQKDEWRMLVEGYDKLVSNLEGNVTHLYNLADDPYETANLANAPAYQLKRDALLAQQRVWMKKLEDGVDASGLKKR
jgi:arylsulfatase A-like enzyme